MLHKKKFIYIYCSCGSNKLSNWQYDKNNNPIGRFCVDCKPTKYASMRNKNIKGNRRHRFFED